MNNEMHPIERWARENFQITELDSVSRKYTGKGPPAWRAPQPEMVRDLDPREPSDWWHMVCLMDLRQAVDQDMRVLDIGCGAGWPSIALAPHVREIVAVDKSELALSLITSRIQERSISNVAVHHADAACLPFGDSSVDAVVASDVVNVVPDPSAVAAEVFRVLKPGGHLVSWVQNFRYILGEARRCDRCVSRDGDRVTYTCHIASVAPPDSLDLRFEVNPRHPVAAQLTPTEEPTLASPESVLGELKVLRPALADRVELYREHEFVPETAAAPFASAGFAELTVSPLNHDACSAFAQQLIRQGAVPQNGKEFAIQAAALRAAMTYADFDRSWLISVKGVRPV